MAFVADNSVIVAWIADRQATPYTRAMFRRLDREPAHVPALWPFEFANALWTLQRRARLRPHEVDAAIALALDDMELQIDRDPVGLRSLLNVARRTNLTAYDAAYIELAARRGLPLATKERRMQDAAALLDIPRA